MDGHSHKKCRDMPPKVHLQPYLTLEEIKSCYRDADDTTEARRWQLLLMVAKDWTVKQAAQVLTLNYDYAKDIVRRYNREGPISVKNRNRERPGPPSRSLLTLEQQEELRQLLNKPPPDGGLWSGPKVAAWMAEKIGVDRIWPQRGWDYLRKLGINNRQRRQRRDLQQNC